MFGLIVFWERFSASYIQTFGQNDFEGEGAKNFPKCATKTAYEGEYVNDP